MSNFRMTLTLRMHSRSSIYPPVKRLALYLRALWTMYKKLEPGSCSGLLKHDDSTSSFPNWSNWKIALSNIPGWKSREHTNIARMIFACFSWCLLNTAVSNLDHRRQRISQFICWDFQSEGNALLKKLLSILIPLLHLECGLPEACFWKD